MIVCYGSDGLFGSVIVCYEVMDYLYDSLL